jgi:hypothetical protein
MELTLCIPDDVAKRLSAAGGGVSRRALEALAREAIATELSQSLPDFGDAGPVPSRDQRLLGTTSCPSI